MISDAERMDWLERTGPHIHVQAEEESSDSEWRVTTFATESTPVREFSGQTLRAAIDSAILSELKP